MKRGKYRKGIFAVVYSKTKKGIEYLILKRKLNWTGWEFIKGGREFMETKKNSVKREVVEETGLKVLKIKDMKLKDSYKYRGKLKNRPGVIGQTFYLYAVEIVKGRVKIDKSEHSDYKWMNFEKALKKLTWKNQRKCLRVVNSFLLNGEKN